MKNHSTTASSLKILLFFFVLWANWELLSPYVAKDVPNPFTPLLFISPRRKLLYATDVWSNTLEPLGNFQHLTCFLGGLFALGAATIPNVDPRHAWAAEGLAHSCWISYADSKTGLGPEVMSFREEKIGRRWVDALADWERAGRPGGVPPGVNQTQPVTPGEDTEYVVADSQYILRPEVGPSSSSHSCERASPHLSFRRPSKVSTSSTGRPGIQNGKNAVGPCSTPFRSTRRSAMPLQLS